MFFSFVFTLFLFRAFFGLLRVAVSFISADGEGDSSFCSHLIGCIKLETCLEGELSLPPRALHCLMSAVRFTPARGNTESIVRPNWFDSVIGPEGPSSEMVSVMIPGKYISKLK